MTGDLDAILASIDGALADADLPDAMRWSPDPQAVDDAGDAGAPYTEDPYLPLTTIRGGIRYGTTPARVIADDPEYMQPAVEHAPGCSIVHRYVDRPSSCQCGALDRAYATLPARSVLLCPLTMPDAMRLALQAEQFREEYEQTLADLRALFAPAAEAVTSLLDAFGKIAADAGLRFSELVEAIAKGARDPWRPIPPPRRLRTEDPKAYALALRQARSTGPDRQVQHRPRPRRHA